MAVELDELPSCLVVDLRMPGLSGLELQELLLERGLELSIVFISGRADVQSGIRAMKGGAVDFLREAGLGGDAAGRDRPGARAGSRAAPERARAGAARDAARRPSRPGSATSSA